MSRPSEPRQNSYKYRPVHDSWPEATFSGRLLPSTGDPMLIDQASRPRKRSSRDWDQAQAQEKNWEHNHCKRRKGVNVTPSQPSSAFWDNLSEVHLTRAALRELHRRTSVTRPDRIHSHKSCRPVTRSLARLDTKPQAPVTADIYTEQCNVGTQDDLKRFARRGGPDMTDERGRPRPGVASRSQRARSSRQNTSETPRQNRTPTPSNRTSGGTSSTRNTGPYNRNFEQHLIDHDVFPDAYEYPDGQAPPLPSNWDEINERLRMPRASLSPSRFTEQDFRRFKKADAHAFKERQVTTSVIPIIEGTIQDARCTAGGIVFGNLDPLTDGTIVPGNPDIYYGARPEQLDPRVRQELSGLIVPSTQDNLPICPNFFVAAKGPDGSLAVALRQASYDGALGARGMHNLQSYKQSQLTSSDVASTITLIYHGGQLKMYTSHCNEASGSDKKPEYCMHQLNTWGMTGNAESFRQGAAAYRNARDWAEEQRNKAIEVANATIPILSFQSSAETTAISTQVEGDSSTLDIAGASTSPESAQYTTPPSGEQSLEATLYLEHCADPDTNKRSRRHLQGSSPAQQKKRFRQKQLDRSPSPEPSTVATALSTGLSYRLEDHGLDPEEDDRDDRTEVLSSDEEATRRLIYKA